MAGPGSRSSVETTQTCKNYPQTGVYRALNAPIPLPYRPKECLYFQIDSHFMGGNSPLAPILLLPRRADSRLNTCR